MKCDIPISSRLLFLRLELAPLRPCRRELDLRSNMSSATRSEFERPLASVMMVGLSGSDNELAFVVGRGARGGGCPIPDPRRLATWACIIDCEQKLMFDLRLLLCRSKVF